MCSASCRSSPQRGARRRLPDLGRIVGPEWVATISCIATCSAGFFVLPCTWISVRPASMPDAVPGAPPGSVSAGRLRRWGSRREVDPVDSRLHGAPRSCADRRRSCENATGPNPSIHPKGPTNRRCMSARRRGVAVPGCSARNRSSSHTHWAIWCVGGDAGRWLDAVEREGCVTCHWRGARALPRAVVHDDGGAERVVDEGHQHIRLRLRTAPVERRLAIDARGRAKAPRAGKVHNDFVAHRFVELLHPGLRQPSCLGQLRNHRWALATAVEVTRREKVATHALQVIALWHPGRCARNLDRRPRM